MRDVNSRVLNAKVIIALRADLFDRVLRATTDAGFQGEKYQALTLPITWQSDELVEVLDRRVDALVRFRYTGQSVALRDVLPATMDKPKQRGIDFLIERTLLRPRDAIAFFNTCMTLADGDPVISATKLRLAEPLYSDQRLRSLADEWSVQFPKLLNLCDLLRDRSANFHLKDWTREDLDHLCLTVFDGGVPTEGDEVVHLIDYFENRIGPLMLRIHLARILYRTGIIGLKTGLALPVRWSYLGPAEIPLALISDATGVHVHKMLWPVLGIKS